MDIIQMAWIVYLFTSAIHFLVIYNFFGSCFNCIHPRKVVILIYIFIYIADCLVFIAANPIVNIVWSLPVLGALSLLYKGTIQSRISSALFIYLIGYLADFLIASLVVITRKINFIDMDFGMFEYAFGMVASNIIYIVFAYILSKLIGRHKTSKIHSLQWISIVSTPIGSIVIIYNLFLTYYDSTLPMGIVFSAIIIIFINYLVINVYEKILNDFEVYTKNQLLQQQMKYYGYQFFLAETSENLFLSTRHNIKNLLYSIKIDAQNQEIQKIEKRINELLGNIDFLDGPAQSGNLPIDSIINFKAKHAQKMNIIFSVDLRIPEKLLIESTPVCIILGNILDNAIEATQEVVQEHRRIIEIAATYEHSNVFFQVMNPYIGAIHLAADGEILSKKREWRTTGIGLQSIQNELDAIDGAKDIDFSNNMFTIKIILYNVNSASTLTKQEL